MRGIKTSCGLLVALLLLWPVRASAHCGGPSYDLSEPLWSLVALTAIIILETAYIRRVLKLPFPVTLAVMLLVNLVSFSLPYLLTVLVGQNGLSFAYMPLEILISGIVNDSAEGYFSFPQATILVLIGMVPYTFFRFFAEAWLASSILTRVYRDMTYSRVATAVVSANAVAVVIFLLILSLAIPFNPPQLGWSPQNFVQITKVGIPPSEWK